MWNDASTGLLCPSAFLIGLSMRRGRSRGTVYAHPPRSACPLEPRSSTDPPLPLPVLIPALAARGSACSSSSRARSGVQIWTTDRCSARASRASCGGHDTVNHFTLNNHEHYHCQREGGNALTQPPVQRPTLRSIDLSLSGAAAPTHTICWRNQQQLGSHS